MTFKQSFFSRMLRSVGITALLIALCTNVNAQMYGNNRNNGAANMVATYFAMRANGDAAGMRIFQRYEFGFTKPTFSGKITHSFQYERGNRTMADTSISMEMHAQSYGVSEGVFFPLGKIGDKSWVTLYWGQQCFIHFLTSDSVYFENPQDVSQREGFAHDGIAMQFGMPIGLDFKYGGEALLDKGERVSYTGGIGIMPSIGQSIISDWAGGKFKATPYIKAEIGVFAGIEWKFRLMYTAGDMLGFKQTSEDGAVATDFTTKSKFSFSLLLMPFSWDWGYDGW